MFELTLTRIMYRGSDVCPVELLQMSVKYYLEVSYAKEMNILNIDTGTLTEYTEIARNYTHVVLTSGIHLLAHMATPATRFYVQLMHPTERLLTQVFYWHAKGRVFPSRIVLNLHTRFLDYEIRQALERITRCLDAQEELWCFHTKAYLPSDLSALVVEGAYVVFLEQLFKMVPRYQVIISSTEEFSNNPVETFKDFFGEEFQESFRHQKGSHRIVPSTTLR
ncbi:uncharacterized protein [Watersipora subatra]|uniref:uncharacterized protein isoform X2 n=1 Tax=Watersipora subatra TaxID=2589382 RepID=UPI00355B0D3E